MQDITIQLEETGNKGRAYAGPAAQALAEMTYSKAGGDVLRG